MVKHSKNHDDDGDEDDVLFSMTNSLIYLQILQYYSMKLILVSLILLINHLK